MALNETLTKELLGKDAAESISKATGVDSSQVTQLLSTALPLLLTGMCQNASSTEGAKSLAAALESHAGEASGDTAQMIAAADAKDGEKAVQHILGAQSKSITQGLSEKTGISSKQVMGVLGTFAPVLLAMLGSNSETGKGNKVDSNGISSVLTSLLLGSSAKSSDNSGLNLASLAGALLGGGSSSGSQGDLLSAAGSLLGGLLGGSGSSEKKNDSAADALGSLLGGLLK